MSNFEQTPAEGKPLVLSKTVWYNIVMVGLYLVNRETEVVPMAIADPLTVVLVSVGNPILRLVTKSRITRIF